MEIENLTAFFMLMRRGGFIKSKNWGMTMDFFHDTLENGHRDMWTIVNKVDTIYKEKVPSTAA